MLARMHLWHAVGTDLLQKIINDEAFMQIRCWCQCCGETLYRAAPGDAHSTVHKHFAARAQSCFDEGNARWEMLQQIDIWHIIN